MAEQDDRATRLAAQLRANLHRRKAQARALDAAPGQDPPRALDAAPDQDRSRAMSPEDGDDPPVAPPPPKP